MYTILDYVFEKIWVYNVFLTLFFHFEGRIYYSYCYDVIVDDQKQMHAPGKSVCN